MALVNKKNIKSIKINNDMLSEWIKKGFKDKRAACNAELTLTDKVSIDNFAGMMPFSENEGKDYIQIGDKIYDDGNLAVLLAVWKGKTKWILADYAVLSTKEIKRRITDYLEY